MEKKSDQPQNLLNEVMKARDRWLEIIKKKKIKEKIAGNISSERSPRKTLYFVRPSESWWPEIKAEIDELKSKLTEFKKSGKSVSRKLWLPTVINGAQHITLRIYKARSERKVTFETAKKFAQKTDISKKALETMNENQEYRINSSTGRKYLLSATNDSGTENYAFTEWALCLCPGEDIPECDLKKIPHNHKEDNSKKLICENKRSALYVNVPRIGKV